MSRRPAPLRSASSNCGASLRVAKNSGQSRIRPFSWGVRPTTWLSFSTGRSTSADDFADVAAETLVDTVDHRFDTVGFNLGFERWGDPAALETTDLLGSVYFVRERWRLALGYENRDIEIPFTLSGPLGNTLHRTAEVAADSYRVDLRLSVAQNWRLFLGAAEYDYERNLSVLPRIDRLNLLSASTLTLANSFIDDQRSLGFENDLGRTLLNVRFATDRSAIDGSKFETVDVALLMPIGLRMDLEVNLGRGRSEFGSGSYAGLMLLIYSR
jgi:hypothetical protein